MTVSGAVLNGSYTDEGLACCGLDAACRSSSLCRSVWGENMRQMWWVEQHREGGEGGVSNHWIQDVGKNSWGVRGHMREHKLRRYNITRGFVVL